MKVYRPTIPQRVNVLGYVWKKVAVGAHGDTSGIKVLRNAGGKAVAVSKQLRGACMRNNGVGEENCSRAPKTLT